MSTSPGPLQPASLVCCHDGSISAIDGAFVCPDFPGIDDLQDADPTLTEILDHIDSAGIAVTSLVSAVTGIHQLLDGQVCGSDTIASIIEILRDQLGLEIRDPFDALEPPTA